MFRARLLSGLLSLAVTVGLMWAVTAVVQPVQAHDFGGSSSSKDKKCPDGSIRPDCRPCHCKKKNASCCKKPNTGFQVALLSGEETHAAADLSVGWLYPVSLARHYDSSSEYDSALGYGWAFDFDRRMFEYADGSLVLRRGAGRRDLFVRTGGSYQPPRDGVQAQIREMANGGFDVLYPDASRDLFDADGRLVKEISKEGHWHEFIYDSRGKLPLIGTSPNAVDPNVPMIVAYGPRLLRINERSADGQATGAYVTFSYEESTGRLKRAETHDGRSIDYTHDSYASATRGNLLSVASNAMPSWTYAYTDARNPHWLTSDRQGDGPLHTLTYDANGRVTKETVGSTELTIAYGAARASTVLTRKVKDAAGAVVLTAVTSYHFDGDGYLSKEVDALGNEQRHSYDSAKNRSRTEWWDKSSGSLVLRRATDWTYNADGEVLTERTVLASGEVILQSTTYEQGWVASEETTSSLEPGRVYRTEHLFLRDAAGVPVAVAETRRFNDDGSHVATRFSYCSAADVAAPQSDCPYLYLLKSVDGPRTDVADVVAYRYYSSSDFSGCAGATEPCHAKGQMHQAINALGHAYTVLRYDQAGRVRRSVDANGRVTEIEYDLRGRATRQIQRGPDNGSEADDLIVAMSYDDTDRLERVTRGDGAYVEYSYDADSHVTQITDNLGNRIRYTVDSDGNRRVEETLDPQGVVVRRLSREFDSLGRISTQRDAPNRATQFGYDAAGNTVRVLDALGRRSDSRFDALDRLIETTQDATGIASTTGFAYNAAGELVQVTDPKSLPTQYDYDALGRLRQLQSPDTGITDYQYDEAGNRTGQTDARGVQTQYVYDAAGRMTASVYPDPASNVYYDYDLTDAETGCTGSSAIGRLTRMRDASGQTVYCYDSFGRVTERRQTTAGTEYVVRYLHDAEGRLTELTYPSGRTVRYHRDAVGRIAAMDTRASSGAAIEPLINTAGWMPYGPLQRIEFAGGPIVTRSYDQDYRIQSLAATAPNLLSLVYQTDAVGNITRIDQAIGAEALAQVYGYDGLDRLTHARTASGGVVEAWTYDKTGNRTSQQVGSTTSIPYAYPADSHRLASVGGEARSYDAVGNTIQIGEGASAKQWTFDQRNRMDSFAVAGGAPVTYQYNGRGERVRKAGNGPDRRYVYDEGGQLLAEYAGEVLVQEHLWLENDPVATVIEGSVHALVSDHLGSPRMAVDRSRDVAVWRWDLVVSQSDQASNAFGVGLPNQDPDQDGTVVDVSLRFPGQYYDPESQLHYNYFRDYEPSTGRYVESDPIGLSGGISTYGYVGGLPLTLSDPSGLKARVCCRKIPIVPAAHCFIQEEHDDVPPDFCGPLCETKKRTIGLQGPPPFGDSSNGGGQKFINHGFDDPGQSKCGAWTEYCMLSQCLDREYASYSNPSKYSGPFGPNSNTFAYTLTLRCGLKPPKRGWPRPGWGQGPAPEMQR